MSITKDVSIFIAEDHLIARMGLKMLIEQTNHFVVVGEAEDGESAVKQILESRPDVIMMDLGLPKLNGIEATAKIKEALPEAKILIFTTAEDDTSIFAALKAGADGYCLKNISGELLASAIHSVLNGAAWLDPAIANKVLRAHNAGTSASAPPVADLSESKVRLLSLVEQGKGVDEIASELSINDSLVKGLLQELMSQLKGDKAKDKASTSRSSLTINPGDVIGQHYTVSERLGFGGWGAVYKAQHALIDRTVAVKVLHEHVAAEPDMLERFKIEAQTSAAIVHANLVTIHDFGLLEGKVPYLVMEYLEGTSLSDLLDERDRLEEVVADRIFAQICSAIAAIHSKGIVHRDLKPSNIMLVNREGDPYFPKLVDFGIAKVLEGAQKRLTKTGEAIGSPLYMSPEQCQGLPLDHRSDLYSLGCMMYETYTGMPPFVANTALEVVMKQITNLPDRKPLEESQIHPRTIECIFRLLNKAPENRPASATEVRERLLAK